LNSYRVAPQPKFTGAKEFAEKHGLNPASVEQNVPLLVKGLNVADVLKNVAPADRLQFIANLRGLAGNIPLGSIERKDGKIVITSYDNAKGEAKVTEVDELSRPHVYGPETRVETFLQKALGPEPRVIINPVGWTIPNPDVLIQNNPVFKKQTEALKSALVNLHGANHPNLGFTKRASKNWRAKRTSRRLTNSGTLSPPICLTSASSIPSNSPSSPVPPTRGSIKPRWTMPTARILMS
jgi:hypothetical protein